MLFVFIFFIKISSLLDFSSNRFRTVISTLIEVETILINVILLIFR